MAEVSVMELSGLAALGSLGSVCAVLLRSNSRHLEELEKLRAQAQAAADEMRANLAESDETIDRLQALCANYRYHIGAIRAERRELRAEVERLKTRPLEENQNE